MNDRQRIELATYAARQTLALVGALNAMGGAGNVVGRMRDAAAGLSAQRFDAQPSGPSVPDPTFAAATRGVDLAERDLAAIDRIVNQLVALCEKGLRIVDAYPPPRSATEADRLALGRENARTEPGCESCARIPGERGGPRWEPVHPKLHDATDVGGRLEAPMLLCRWCWDCVAAWGRLPSGTELQRHHRGERLSWPNDVPRPA